MMDLSFPARAVVALIGAVAVFTLIGWVLASLTDTEDSPYDA